MSKHGHVMFCTGCCEFTELRFFPLPYWVKCPFCGLEGKLMIRRKWKGNVQYLKGLLCVTLSSEIGNKLLKLNEEKRNVARAVQK